MMSIKVIHDIQGFILQEREPVPMDLESEDEEKENEVDPENGVEGQEDEMNNSHLMEELWDGGKIFGYLNRLSIYVNVLKESSCRRSREESVPGSCRCVDIITKLLCS